MGSLWRRLDVTEAAIRRLVGPPFVDYVHLRRQGSSSSSSSSKMPSDDNISFARRGADGLDDGAFLQTLRGGVLQAAAAATGGGRANEVAVFDVVDDRGGLSSGGGGYEDGVLVSLSWCPYQDGPYAERPGRISDCEETWREAI